MRLLLVTFSLRNGFRDYSNFFVTLRGNALNWWHFIEQTCLVSTYLDANAFAQKLLPHVETTDSVLVVEVKPNEFQGWLPKSAWDWLAEVSKAIVAEQSQLTFPPPFLPSPPKLK